MMKKVIVIFLIILGIVVYTRINTEEVMIPNEAIRFRVIANSNSIQDQNTKLLVRNDLEKEISMDLKDSNSINDSRKILSSNIDMLIFK